MYRYTSRYIFVAAVLLLMVSGLGTVSAQSVDEVNTTLSDETGDGVDDMIVVEVEISSDDGYNPVAVVEFGERIAVDLSDTELTQADPGFSQINDDQPKENVTFGSSDIGGDGIAGRYTVRGQLSNPGAGDSVEITVWTGDVERSEADSIKTVTAIVQGAGNSEGRDIGDGDDVDADSVNQDDSSVDNVPDGDGEDDGDSNVGDSAPSDAGTVDQDASDDTSSTDRGTSETGDRTNNEVSDEEKNATSPETATESNGTGISQGNDERNGESQPGFTVFIAAVSILMLALGAKVGS